MILCANGDILFRIEDTDQLLSIAGMSLFWKHLGSALYSGHKSVLKFLYILEQ